MRNKTVTLIGANFYPEDSAIGLYSTDMIKYIQSQGYEINVITGFPYYPQWEIRSEYINKPMFYKEKIDGMRVYRYKQYVPKKPNFIKRIIHLTDFTLGSILNIFKIKETNIIISTVPFTSCIFLGWLLKVKCKAKLWVHVQDFEFDAALQTGLTGDKPSFLRRFAFTFFFKLEKWMFSKADRASSISYTMLSKLKTKIHKHDRIVYLPNWIDANKISPAYSKPHNYLLSNKFKILYSGNIGDKQNWDFFLNFLSELDKDLYDVVIVGDGSKRDWLVNKLSDYKNVNYYPPIGYEELSNLLCSADAHFLFQKEDVVDTVMPSKLLGMMASGKPSIVSGNVESEVKKVLEESEGGFYVLNSDVSKVLEIINKLYTDKNLGLSVGKKAREYVIKNFSREKILSNLCSELEKI